MKCNRVDQDRLTSLAAGELSWGQSWLLRRHLNNCPDCWAQWEETQRLWADLRALASQPAPETLRARIFAQLRLMTPPARRQPSLITIGGITMNRRTFALTSTALLLIVTGALAARLIGFRPSGGFSDHAGRMWNFSSGFKGVMTVFDAQGAQIGAFRSDAGDPEEGSIDLSVAGRHYDLHGLGQHDIRDAQGNLIGYAVLSPLSAQDVTQMQKEEQDRMPRDFAAAARWERQHLAGSGMSSGMDTFPVCLAGFDGRKKAFWMMRGQGTVQVIQPEGKSMTGKGSTTKMTPELRASLPPEFQFSDEELKTPQFALMVGDKVAYEQGYGTHLLKDSAGKTLLILKAAPLAP